MAFSVGYTVDDSITYADMMVLKEYNGKTGNTDSHKVYGDGAIYYGKGLK